MGSQCSACESEAPHEVVITRIPYPQDDLLQNVSAKGHGSQRGVRLINLNNLEKES